MVAICWTARKASECLHSPSPALNHAIQLHQGFGADEMELRDQFAEQQFLAANVAMGQKQPIQSVRRMSAPPPRATEFAVLRQATSRDRGIVVAQQ
jgi:hypothetical protein